MDAFKSTLVHFVIGKTGHIRSVSLVIAVDDICTAGGETGQAVNERFPVVGGFSQVTPHELPQGYRVCNLCSRAAQSEMGVTKCLSGKQ